jgi:hypothetical protein
MSGAFEVINIPVYKYGARVHDPSSAGDFVAIARTFGYA